MTQQSEHSERQDAPHLVTRAEALAALDAVSPVGRQLVAHMVGQLWVDGPALAAHTSLPAGVVAALGMPVAVRRHADGEGAVGWTLEPPMALVEDISELVRYDGFLPTGWTYLTVSEYLLAGLLAILTGEPQPYDPPDAHNLWEGGSANGD